MRTKTLLIYINKTSKIKANEEYSLSLYSLSHELFPLPVVLIVRGVKLVHAPLV
jgi:hypothetical protein